MHTQLCTDIVLVFDIFKAKRQCKHPSQSPFGGEVTVAVGRLAMTLVYRYFHRFFPHFFPRRDLFSYKECSDQKTYLAKVDQSVRITMEK